MPSNSGPFPYREMKSRFEDVKELLPEAESLGDAELIHELVQAFKRY